ncbi:MAG: protoheme IX farnesyltransferase [Bacteroidales bacterium]|nr:protoheme IX farnesyltransferase [Bacteroidales bacterium]
MPRFLKNLLSLTKFYLSLAIAFSALAGYVIFSGSFSDRAFLASLAVFLLAAGAGALNQLQERNRDALMERTKRRPIPSGAISPWFAGILSVILALAGFLILLLNFGMVTAFLGLGNLLWYNVVYTPLKIRSYFAVLAGAVNGAVPPVVGWVAAGGYILDPKILFITFFIFLWQVPHFWLLLMLYGEEYEKAGFYSITSRFSFPVIRNILLIWVVATSFSTLFLLLFQIITLMPLIITMMTAVVILQVFFFIFLYTGKEPPRIKPLFIVFNLFMVLVFGMILVQGAIG